MSTRKQYEESEIAKLNLRPRTRIYAWHSPESGIKCGRSARSCAFRKFEVSWDVDDNVVDAIIHDLI